MESAEQGCKRFVWEAASSVDDLWCPQCEKRLLPGQLLSKSEATDIPGTLVSVHAKCSDPYACPSCGGRHPGGVPFRCKACGQHVCEANVEGCCPASEPVPMEGGQRAVWHHVIGRARIVCGLAELLRQ